MLKEIQILEDLFDVKLSKEPRPDLSTQYKAVPLRNSEYILHVDKSLDYKAIFKLKSNLELLLVRFEQLEGIADEHTLLGAELKTMREAANPDFESETGITGEFEFIKKLNADYAIFQDGRLVVNSGLDSFTLATAKQRLVATDTFEVFVKQGELIGCKAENFCLIILSAVQLSNAIKDVLQAKLWWLIRAQRHATSELDVIFNTFPDTYIRLDANNKILDYKAPPHMTPLDGALGRYFQDILPDSVNRQMVAQAIQQVRQTNEIASIEYPHTTQKQKFFFEARLAPLHKTQIVIIIRDITERKEAERELREYREHLEELVDERTLSLNEEIEQHKQTAKALQINEERLRTLINSTPDIICFKDGQGRWLEANDADLELFALTDVDYYNKTDSELAAFTAPMYEEAFLGCEVSDEETWESKSLARGVEVIPTMDGTEKVYDVIKVPLFEPDGSRKGLVVLGRDITERDQIQKELEKYRDHLEELVQKRTESLAKEVEQHQLAKNALQKSEKRFRRLFEAAPDGIAVLDNEGIIIEANPAFLRLHNRPFDELVGRRINAFVPPHFRQVFQQITLPKLQQLEPQELEVQVTQAGGNLVDVWRKGSPIANTEDNFNGILIYDRDITVLKQAEAELQRAKKEAETANQAKSAFLSNMSHELRTPLNGILGYTQIFKRDSTLTTKQLQGIDIIHSSGEHLLVMINDILDLSKIEADRMELVPSEFNLPNFVQSLVYMIQARAEQKGLLFDYQPDLDLPVAVLADETRLRQILLNLLSNAIKFTEQGRVTLRVRRSESDPSSPIRFEIEDSGVGITVEQQAHIFEPFRQVGDEQVMHKGTGLGLAISQRLVQMMGGDLCVESDGSGSRFWFELPLLLITRSSHGEAVKTSQEIGYTRTTGSALPATTAPFKILVVDDFEPNRTVLNILLTSLGFTVGEADSGLDGITQIASFKPDFIFMDLVMPDMDGLETTRQIRRMPNGRFLPIIALSANLNVGVQKECLIAGCDGYLPKPFEAGAILEALQQHLPLQWLYVDEDAQSESQELVFPPKEDMDVMLKFSMYGDIGGVRRCLVALGEKGDQYAPFIAELNQLVAEYKMHEIQQYLQGCLDLE